MIAKIMLAGANAVLPRSAEVGRPSVLLAFASFSFGDSYARVMASEPPPSARRSKTVAPSNPTV